MENILIAIGLLLLNSVFMVATIFQLPGNWLMVAGVGGVMLWKDSDPLFAIETLIILAVIALIAEIVEFAAGSAGTRLTGGSKRSSLWALVGGFIGGIAGTVLLPIPIVGSVLGACGGAFLGALAGERKEGKTMGKALSSGGGAAAGRFLGIIGKLGAGALIWLIVAVAAFWP